jgi:hypothetical protein
MGLSSCLSFPPTCTSAALWGTTTDTCVVTTAGGVKTPDNQCCAVAGAGSCSGMQVYQQGKRSCARARADLHTWLPVWADAMVDCVCAWVCSGNACTASGQITGVGTCCVCPAGFFKNDQAICQACPAQASLPAWHCVQHNVRAHALSQMHHSARTCAGDLFGRQHFLNRLQMQPWLHVRFNPAFLPTSPSLPLAYWRRFHEMRRGNRVMYCFVSARV